MRHKNKHLNGNVKTENWFRMPLQPRS